MSKVCGYPIGPDQTCGEAVVLYVAWGKPSRWVCPQHGLLEERQQSFVLPCDMPLPTGDVCGQPAIYASRISGSWRHADTDEPCGFVCEAHKQDAERYAPVDDVALRPATVVGPVAKRKRRPRPSGDRPN